MATTKKTMSRGTEFAQDMTALSDKDMISDVLTSHKGMMKRYTTALSEVSCDKLRSIVTTHLTECSDDQFDAFLYMNERNLYPTEPAPTQKISQAKQKYTATENEIKK